MAEEATSLAFDDQSDEQIIEYLYNNFGKFMTDTGFGIYTEEVGLRVGYILPGTEDNPNPQVVFSIVVENLAKYPGASEIEITIQLKGDAAVKENISIEMRLMNAREETRKGFLEDFEEYIEDMPDGEIPSQPICSNTKVNKITEKVGQ